MEKVTRLDKYANTANRSVQQLLEDELEDIKKGEQPATKAVIIYLDNSEGAYAVGWSQANMTMSECIALVEIAKESFKNEMGY